MVGIDEVGRGSWAGPLLVVAVRTKGQSAIKQVADSKMLSRSQRRVLVPEIAALCDIGAGWVTAVEIDKLGLGASLTLGALRALQAVKAVPDEQIILDGKHNYVPRQFTNSQSVVKADSLVSVVSMASVWAKEARDAFMIELANLHPQYGFESHVGYGTKRHREALNKYGPIQRVHRFCFAPIARLRLEV